MSVALHPNHPLATPAELPSSIEAEQAVLGALIYDNAAFELVADIVKAEHFHEPLHGRLFDAAAAAIRAGRLASPITVYERMGADAALQDFGGIVYLADLVDRAPPAANAADYARIVAENAGRRAVLGLVGLVSTTVRDPASGPLTDILASLERGAAEIANETALSESWTPAGAAMREAIQQAQNRSGTIDYPFGVGAVDRFAGGMNAGEVTILAARTGMGKTVGALNIARACASQRLGVCFFSLEMTRYALSLRLAADVAYDRSAAVFGGSTITFDKAMKGDLVAHQWHRLNDAADIVQGWPLEIDDRSGLTMAQIEAAARRQHRRWVREGIKPGPVIIDHLGKVRPPIDRRGARSAEVADVSNEAQQMAKRLGVPVLALVQLNRGVEGRDDKRPNLADLRQAGELEEDARQVVFLYRPEYYLREGGPDESFEDRAKRLEKLEACKNQLFWIVEKNSHGPRGQVLTFCDIGASAIREWER